MMAYSTSSSHSSSFTLFSLVFCLLALLSFFTQATVAAGRQVPAAAKVAASDKKLQTECEEQDGNGNGNGNNLIQAGVRIGLSSVRVSSVTMPPSMSVPSGSEIGDLDHSGPAAANGQYIPGADDTFIPNPGYEVPNPIRGSINP